MALILVAINRSNWRAMLALVAFGIVWPVFIYFSVVPAARTLTHGFAAHYAAARVLLDGNIEQVNNVAWFHVQLAQMGFGAVQDVVHQNPPTIGLLMLPVAALQADAARVWWTVFNVVFVLGTWVVLARVAHARGRVVPSGWVRLVIFATLLAALSSTWENMRWGQAYLLLALLSSLSLWAAASRRNVLAGLLIVPVLVSKPYYGAFMLLVLALHRRWWAIAASLTGTAIVIAAFWPLAGLDAWRQYTAFAPTINDLPYVAHTSQQTINGLAHRLLAYDQVWNPNPLLMLGEGAATTLRIVTISGLLTLTVRAALKKNELWFSFSTLLTLGPLAAPVAEPHHLALAVLAIGYVVLREDVAISGWMVVGIGLLILPWPIREQSLWGGGWAVLAYPRLYGAILLLVGLIRIKLLAVRGPALLLANDARA